MKKLVLIFIALCCVGLGVALTISMMKFQDRIVQDDSENQDDGLLKTSGQFKDKLAEIKIKRDRAETQIERLSNRQKEALKKLRDKGISKSSDIQSDDRESRLLLAELEDLVEKVDKLKKDIVIYDDAIVSIEAILRDFDRDLVMSDSGINEEQLKQLRTIVYQVEDELESEKSLVDELTSDDLVADLLSELEDDEEAND